jgi:menaquinol-cytochrome c reductase iron-sulfur subunit
MPEQTHVPPATGDYSSTRRTFHLAIIYILGAVISLALAIPTAVYLLAAPRKRGTTKWIDLGDTAQLTPGMPTEISFQENRLDGWRVSTEKRTAWVIKNNDSSVVAFGPICTHLGCAYHVENGQFVCPCHTSVFSFDGKVISGPAPRPLDRYETKIENNRLEIGELKRSDA